MSIIVNPHRFIALLIFVLLFVSACGSNAAEAPGTTADSDVQESVASSAEVGEAAARPEEEKGSIGAGEPASRKDVAATPLPAPTIIPPSWDKDEVVEESFESESAEEEMAMEAAPPEADDSRDLGGGGIAVEEEAPIVRQSQSEPLRAGEVDDNAQWDDYLLYRRNYQGPQVHDRDISERYIIEVEDGQGNPILGAEVSIFLNQQQKEEIYTARTYANGQVIFHPLALDIPIEQVNQFVVEVQYEDFLEQFSLTRLNAQTNSNFTERWTVSLNTQQERENIDLDVLFLLDATGSMSDEIATIQSTIFDVAARIDELPAQPSVRYGLVTYRDRGDSFVARTYEFTPDVRDFSKNLNTVFADGGGDYPESVNEGLHKALNDVEWRGGETIQLIFLVADAPPHLDYEQDYDYAEEMISAARRAIKIFPIASSGLDDQGEYIFRQIAQYTQGRFIFLTYEGPTNSGPPGDETTHHVEDYSVENLDDLLVRLVTEELAYQNPTLIEIE